MEIPKKVIDILEESLKKDCILFQKNGKIITVNPVGFGKITFHFQNGKVDRVTTEFNEKF